MKLAKSAGLVSALLGLACAGGVDGFAIRQRSVANNVHGESIRSNSRSFQWTVVDKSLKNTQLPLVSQTGGHAQTSLHMSLALRGGADGVAKISSLLSSCTSSPLTLFNSCLLTLGATTAIMQIAGRRSGSKEEIKKAKAAKPAGVRSLQRKFLAVFWLLRCADWLQGPYFYEVYASKFINGAPATATWISRLFLTGFASTAFFGPFIGRLADERGRKLGTLLFCALYSMGAASTTSSLLGILLLGRVLSGIGTSLLFSAPESWLVSEAQKKETGDSEGKYLGETFGLAYAGDSIVAIFAGQLAGAAASKRGPTGPFQLSLGFLAAGAALTALLWKENKAVTSTPNDSSSENENETSSKPTIADAWKVVKSNPHIMLVGAVQSLFEAAMYIFVLQWPPAIQKAVQAAFPAGSITPYGTVFSCFMASCLVGSTLFGKLVGKIPTESFATAMLATATASMIGAVVAAKNAALYPLMLSFFLFEACVGMYFPSIGTLRSKYIPDSHRGVILNLFGIPLNLLVVSVFLSIQYLGVTGALTVSSAALGTATCAMFTLMRRQKRNDSEKTTPALAA
mmetsp:Transcript_6807/g.6388  ORF Transcript_6807/g.6388 Transcript_6807/m.6388 type:complete len:570 (-) Transcript_6807:412-2121(-)